MKVFSELRMLVNKSIIDESFGYSNLLRKNVFALFNAPMMDETERLQRLGNDLDLETSLRVDLLNHAFQGKEWPEWVELSYPHEDELFQIIVIFPQSVPSSKINTFLEFFVGDSKWRLDLLRSYRPDMERILLEYGRSFY
jgi:hypothetical protein